MLHSRLGEAVWEDEVDWAQPRPQAWDRVQAWGSQRTTLFSGLRWGSVYGAYGLHVGLHGMHEIKDNGLHGLHVMGIHGLHGLDEHGALQLELGLNPMP